jgi:4-amino-4-deoxy-L-arabinose transferase-like glycosyltransferase
MPVRDPDAGARWFFSCALIIAAALIAGRSRVHVCDSDAQLYRVVARNIVERGAWSDLTYTPAVHARFREHLPFGLWPTAAVIAVFGERALPLFDGLWTLTTIAVVGFVARRLWGAWAAAGAVFVLGTTDAFGVFCSFTKLDGPTVLFSFLSALPWIFGLPGPRGVFASVLCAAVACGVKGPFGLVMVAVTSTSRALVSRSWRVWLLGIVATIGAALPVSAFLVYERFFGDASWWNGYVRAQLISSFAGTRPDGNSAWWYPFFALSHQFWPGVVLLAFAAWHTWIHPDARRRVICFSFLLGLSVLCIPGRKNSNHLLVVYPIGALWVGETFGVVLAWTERWRRGAFLLRGAVGGAAVTICALVIAGRPPWVHESTCLPRSGLSLELANLGPWSGLILVSEKTSWRDIAALAAEYRLTAWPVRSWGALAAVPRDVRVAVNAEPSNLPTPPEWRLVSAVPGWSMWRRIP